MTWFNSPMIGFDIESTSSDPEEARIVQAALVVVNDGPTTDHIWLVNPGVEIPAEAIEIHGITNEEALADGMDPAVAVRQIAESIASYSGHPLVIQNARYDLTVVDRECRRHGLDDLLPLVHGPVIDPLVIDKWLNRFRKGSRKLDAICAHYGVMLDDAHDAGADALAATRAAWVLGARGEVIRKVWNAKMGAELAYLKSEWEHVRHDPVLLQEAQVHWAYEQAVGLEEYFRETDPDARVETAWPVVPFGARVGS